MNRASEFKSGVIISKKYFIIVLTGILLSSFLLYNVTCNGENDPIIPEQLKSIKAAYRKYIKEVKFNKAASQIKVIMKDGREILWDDGKSDKTFKELLNMPDLEDQLSMAYPRGRNYPIPKVNHDPGRIRVQKFFKSVYGIDRESVNKNLTEIKWLPKHSKKRLLFNYQNGAADALKKVSKELDQLPKELLKYVKDIGGTFVWRKIEGSNRLSAHSFGIAIDINVKYSDYWSWNIKKEPKLPYHNRIPLKIVEIFEKHGFIWGGKWYHYDTMHFEFRPEFFHPSHRFKKQ